MLEYIILGYLFTTPMTEKTLRSNISVQIKPFYHVTEGSLYPTLKRMVTKQYILLRPINDGSKKKQYYITDKGREYFKKWIEEPVNLPYSYLSEILKIFFAGNLDSASRTRLLTEFETNTLIQLQKFEMMKEEYHDTRDHDDIEYYQKATLYLEILSLRGSLKWCQSLKNGHSLSELL